MCMVNHFVMWKWDMLSCDMMSLGWLDIKWNLSCLNIEV